MSAAAWALADIGLLALLITLFAGLTWAGRRYNHTHQPHIDTGHEIDVACARCQPGGMGHCSCNTNCGNPACYFASGHGGCARCLYGDGKCSCTIRCAVKGCQGRQTLATWTDTDFIWAEEAGITFPEGSEP